MIYRIFGTILYICSFISFIGTFAGVPVLDHLLLGFVLMATANTLIILSKLDSAK